MQRAATFFLVLLFLGIAVVNCCAQTRIIDSLKANVSRAKSPFEKSEALLALCNQKYSLPADLLFRYASMIKELNKDAPAGKNMILAEYYLAYSQLINGFEDKSLRTANFYIDKLKDSRTEQDLYKLFLHLRGTIYYRTNRSKETVNNYYELLSIAQQQNDTLNMLIAKRGISLAYIANGQDKEGVKIFHSAMPMIAKPVPARYAEIYGLLLVNASISYLHLHQRTNLMFYADSCEYYGTRVIETGKKTDNLFIQCQGLIVTGVILSYKKQVEAAEKSLKEGLEIRKVIADTIYILSDMSVLGSFYANTRQVEKGVAICKAGIELAQRRKISPALLLPLYSALAENYKVTGYYKEYADALKKLMNVKDSINLKSSVDELKNLEIKYDLQKKGDHDRQAKTGHY